MLRVADHGLFSIKPKKTDIGTLKKMICLGSIQPFVATSTNDRLWQFSPFR